jgi:hypothetical protein
LLPNRLISKKVATKTPEKSRFGKLVAYLLDPPGKKTRVGEVAITDCVSSDTNLSDEFFGERITTVPHLVENSPTYCACVRRRLEP